MSPRPRHQKKELELLLKRAEQLGWKVDRPKKYFRLRCGCGKHMKWIHLTPSNPNYAKDVLSWLEATCNTSEGDRQ